MRWPCRGSVANKEDAPKAGGRVPAWLGWALFVLAILAFSGMLRFKDGYPRLAHAADIGFWLGLNVLPLCAFLLAFYAGIVKKNTFGRFLLAASGMLLAISTVLSLRPAEPTAYTSTTDGSSVISPQQSTVASSLPPRDSRFSLVTLPLGVSIQVPKNWRLLGAEINATLETAGEAGTKLAGITMPRGQKVNLFRANSNPPTTYASIAINATDSEMSPADMMAASDAEIAELGESMHRMFEQSFAKQNLRVIRFDGVRREILDGHPSLIIHYVRSGPQGPVVVQMTRLLIGEKEISLNLSYRQSEANLWKPIIDYIRSTFRVSQP